MEDVFKALTFSESKIRDYLREKDVEGMKSIFRGYSSMDLKMFSDIAISYELYEVCRAVKDILQERKNK